MKKYNIRNVIKPKKNISASTQTVDDPVMLSELVDELEEYLADHFEDNLVMQFSSYVDDEYMGEDIDTIVNRYNAAKMQYLMCTAKLIRRGDWI